MGGGGEGLARLQCSHILHHLCLGCEDQPPIESRPALTRRSDHLCHGRVAEPPVPASDLAEQLRATPLGIPPYAVHHRRAVAEHLQSRAQLRANQSALSNHS